MELFEQVQAGGEKKLQFAWEGAIWKPGKIYRVESVKEQHLLSLNWPLPCLDHAYLKKPHDYISHLIGHGNVLARSTKCPVQFDIHPHYI